MHEAWYTERVKSTRGITVKYETQEEIEDKFIEYVESEMDRGRYPNKAGMVAYLFGSNSSYVRYSRDEFFYEVFEKIELILEDITLNCKDIDSNTKKLVLQSKYGYAERVNSQTLNGNVNIMLDGEKADKYKKELEEKYGILVDGE